MALSNEDKKDVAGALGKKMANKVSKVTKDKYHDKYGNRTKAERFDIGSKITVVPSAKSSALKEKTEPLNAWGQDAKTAKAVRASLRKDKTTKSFMKGASKRFDAGY